MKYLFQNADKFYDGAPPLTLELSRISMQLVHRSPRNWNFIYLLISQTHTSNEG